MKKLYASDDVIKIKKKQFKCIAVNKTTGIAIFAPKQGSRLSYNKDMFVAGIEIQNPQLRDLTEVNGVAV